MVHRRLVRHCFNREHSSKKINSLCLGRMGPQSYSHNFITIIAFAHPLDKISQSCVKLIGGWLVKKSNGNMAHTAHSMFLYVCVCSTFRKVAVDAARRLYGWAHTGTCECVCVGKSTLLSYGCWLPLPSPPLYTIGDVSMERRRSKKATQRFFAVFFFAFTMCVAEHTV